MSPAIDIASAPSPEAARPASYPRKGFRIGEYVITDLLGHGAMASVFLATDSTGHEVALKVFQEGPGVSETMLERFRREAEASKKLRRHPNIMPVYATGRDGPYHYIAMESVRHSRTLETVLETSMPDTRQLMDIVIKIARALQYAHTHHIVHRDVKPTNIMIDEFGEPLLSDFGVAELVDWPSCTLTGALTGTPLYMSPEQARGERVGPASDQYSLGVVLYEGLTGVLPYGVQHGSPLKDVLEAVKNELPRRPRLFRKDLSPDLEAVLFKALEKNPADRYVDMEAFAADLERVQAGHRVSAHRFSALDYLRHLVRLHQRAVGGMMAGVAIASGTGLIFRERLLKTRYEELLRRAQLKNALYLLAQAEHEVPFVHDTPRAWHEIRQARRHMVEGNWRTARDGFRTAADISRSVGDTRTVAIAELDQARCEIMLHNRAEADGLYQRVIGNPDAPPAVVSLAQMEGMGLAILDGDPRRAREILQLRSPPPDGAVRLAMNGLIGEGTGRKMAEAAENLPHQIRNDVYLAAALRSRLDGEDRLAVGFLRRAIEGSSPSTEWPAPFARLLYAEFQR